MVFCVLLCCNVQEILLCYYVKLCYAICLHYVKLDGAVLYYVVVLYIIPCSIVFGGVMYYVLFCFGVAVVCWANTIVL